MRENYGTNLQGVCMMFVKVNQEQLLGNRKQESKRKQNDKINKSH